MNFTMHIDLSKQKILVTGASRGLGKAIAEQLAASGAQVAVHYHRNYEAANRVAKSIGHNAQCFQADLCKPVEVIQLFANITAEFEKLDCIINNAGVSLRTDPEGTDIDWSDNWSRNMLINLHSVGLLCKKAIAHFKERGGGRIINISSRAAFRGDTADYMGYAASKAGVVALTRSIARAYGKEGIKAFNIAPGFVRTDMADVFIKQYGEAYAVDDIALPQLTEPKDVAPMICMLASGLADHATGCTIDMNAGSYVH